MKSRTSPTSESISAGGIQWQLRIFTHGDCDGQTHLGFALQGIQENGAWSRWLTADFFIFDQHDWRKLGGFSEKMIGSTPLPTFAEERCLLSETDIGYDPEYFIDDDDTTRFRVDFACWKDSFQEKGAHDDVTFIVEGRPVYANKGYITYISLGLRAMLTGNSEEARSAQVHIKQTSAEDFVTFMRAVAPRREPVTDANVHALYGLADVYDVEFLRRDCEKHLMATKGVKAIKKILLAQSLNKTDFITRLVGTLGLADLEKIRRDYRKYDLSEEVKDQLRERKKLLEEAEHS